MTRTRAALKRASFKLYLLGDRFGIHVLPKHYYTPVPDVSWLRHNRDAWIGPAHLDHVDWELDRQLEWLRAVCDGFYDEVEGWSVYQAAAQAAAGPGYGPVESQVLHCVLRRYRPRRIVEVGSGMSTLCMLHACSLNERDQNAASEITCIEPFPRPALRKRNDIQLVESPVQVVSRAVFDQLGENDLLFIDSSHAVKVGSDLARIYLDILPNLAPGVIVQIHDIFLPFLYPRDALQTYFGWQESTLLLALLTDNSRIRVLGCLSALHYDRREELRAILRDYDPQPDDFGLEPPEAEGQGHFPSSIYFVTR